MTTETEGPRLYLFCEGYFIHSTRDPAEVESWLEADPEKHEARDTR